MVFIVVVLVVIVIMIYFVNQTIQSEKSLLTAPGPWNLWGLL
jgi:uncharacterized protein (UPF0333 family)